MTIIISQDEKSIYNFDNLKSIDVIGTGIYVSDNILEVRGKCIAEYDTEERVKKVFAEMGVEIAYKDNKVLDVPIYRMPKE